MHRARNIGPLQLIAVGFEQPIFTSSVAEEIKRLSKQQQIRLVDAAIIIKENSDVIAAEGSGLSLDEAGEYGAYIGALLGIGSGDETFAEELADETRFNFQQRYQYGLSQDDINDVVDSMPDQGVLLVMLIEHLWAVPLRDTLRQAGGYLIAQEFLSPELLIGLGNKTYQELAAVKANAN
jgi:uncharacterized membrane protein